MTQFRGRVLDARSMVCRFKPHWRHCILSLSKTQNILCLVLVKTRNTCHDMTEKLLTGTLKSNKIRVIGALANCEDPGEMRQNVTFHHGLHCLLR